MSQQRRPLTITCVRRDPEHGFWTARVTVAGSTWPVDRMFGSWRVTPRRGASSWRELPTNLAHDLQRRVKPLERKERLDPGHELETRQIAPEAPLAFDLCGS